MTDIIKVCIVNSRKGFQISFKCSILCLRAHLFSFICLHDNVMEIVTSANLSPLGFKTFQQPCVGESCPGNFKTVIMQLSGTQLRHYQLSKASKSCYHFYTPLSTSRIVAQGVRWESTDFSWNTIRSPLGVR